MNNQEASQNSISEANSSRHETRSELNQKVQEQKDELSIMVQKQMQLENRFIDQFSEIEDREIPYDVKDFDSVYFSKSKGYNIKILDLHLTHAIRILNNYLDDNVYPKYSDRQEINDSLRGIRDRVEDISEVVNK